MPVPLSLSWSIFSHINVLTSQLLGNAARATATLAVVVVVRVVRVVVGTVEVVVIGVQAGK